MIDLTGWNIITSRVERVGGDTPTEIWLIVSKNRMGGIHDYVARVRDGPVSMPSLTIATLEGLYYVRVHITSPSTSFVSRLETIQLLK